MLRITFIYSKDLQFKPIKSQVINQEVGWY